MKTTITATLTTTHFVDSPGQAEDLVASIHDLIEKAIGAGAQAIDDIAIDTWDIYVEQDTVELLPAAECLHDIWRDLKTLDMVSYRDDQQEAMLAAARDRGLVDENGMYDPSEGARQYAQQILEQGI